MTIKGSGSLSLNSDIVNEFTGATGKNIGSLRGTTWYLDDVLTTSTFPSTNISFSQFYNKRVTDPAGAGSTSYTPGDYAFTVPLYRNSITFYAWGGGGGSNISGTGDTSTVFLPELTTLVANGGRYGGGGARRYVGPAGPGGGFSGGQIGENGAGGGGAKGPGGNAGGMAYGGGAGATNGGGNFATYPGNPPGGGGSGFFGYDGSKDPGYSGGGGAGGGGFSGSTYNPSNLAKGTGVDIHVAAAGGNGGAGRVNISWG